MDWRTHVSTNTRARDEFPWLWVEPLAPKAVVAAASCVQPPREPMPSDPRERCRAWLCGRCCVIRSFIPPFFTSITIKYRLQVSGDDDKYTTTS
eukprot:scaffold5537_cov112-Isochrysis_galbana.AAC.3